MDLELNSRLVSQYGRGKYSAMKVIPKEIDQVMGLISEAKYRPYELANCLSDMSALKNISYDELVEAIKSWTDADSAHRLLGLYGPK